MSITVPRPGTDRSAPTPAPKSAARTLRWWNELALIVIVYGAYSGGRLLARGDVSTAFENGKQILHLQETAHLTPELPLNRLLTDLT